MKKILLFALILPLFFTACKDDNEVEPTCDTLDVAAIIVGDWTETPLLGIGDEVYFKSDMSGSCTTESLFVTEFNGVSSSSFTWALNADNSVITLVYTNGMNPEYSVVSVECDKIKLELFGFIVELNRK